MPQKEPRTANRLLRSDLKIETKNLFFIQQNQEKQKFSNSNSHSMRINSTDGLMNLRDKTPAIAHYQVGSDGGFAGLKDSEMKNNEALIREIKNENYEVWIGALGYNTIPYIRDGKKNCRTIVSKSLCCLCKWLRPVHESLRKWRWQKVIIANRKLQYW